MQTDMMKNILYISLTALILWSCGTAHKHQIDKKNDAPVQIGNDDLDFKLVIFEPGFDLWLSKQPPMESYALDYLESKNRRFVNAYNLKVLTNHGQLYPQTINYDSSVEYGLELNYKLFMYFKFFQEKYQQKL